MTSHDDPMCNHNGKEPPLDPELVSAFYDGETTPEERAAVEESMDEAGETLHTLDEYDQLSQSLKSLHQSQKAGDLRSAVMSQIGPLAAPAGPPDVRKPGRMFSVIAGLTGLAAAVTLLLWPQSQPGTENMLAVNDRAPAESSAVSATGATLDEAHRAEPMAGEGLDAAAAMPPASAMAVEPMASRAEMEAAVEGSLAEISRQKPLPAVGDVLGYMDRNADDLTWVAVTVVDVQEAGNQVQLLLARHGVPSPDSDAGDVEPSADPDSLVTFLVEAEWNQMEAVIVDLSDASFVDALEVDAPSGESIPSALQGYAISRTDAGTPATDSQAEVLRKRVEGRQGPDAKSADAAVAGRSGAGGNAVQLQLLVRGEELARIAAQRKAVPPAAGDTPADADADDEATPAESTRIPSTMAAPRFKGVIVIQAKEPR